MKKNVDPRKEVKKPAQLDKNFYILKGIEFRMMKESTNHVTTQSDISVYTFLRDLNEAEYADYQLFDTDPFNDHGDDEAVIKKDKKRKKKTTNENASATATSAASIASVPAANKKPRKRSELFIEDAIKYNRKLREFAPVPTTPTSAAPAPTSNAPMTSPRPLPRPSTVAPASAPVASPRPQPRPTVSAPITSPRPLPRPSTVAPTTAPVSSPRPQPRPVSGAPTASQRPRPRPYELDLE